MRVTNQMMVRSSVGDMTRRLEALDRSRQQLSSGRAITYASDDPAGAGRAMALRSAQTARLQEQRNASDARTQLDLADSSLQGLSSRMRRVRDLVVQGANTNTSATSRAAMAKEIGAIREEAVAIANARHDGRPLFSGFTDADAVVRGPAGWRYQGDAGQVRRRLGESDVVTTNVTADDVFGFADGDDLFTMLDDLEAKMSAGDVDGLGQSLDGIDTATDRVLGGLAEIGAARNRVDAALRRNEDALLAIRGELSLVEDVSLAEATMELQMQETAYQATLGALARALPPSLASFLS